MPTTHPRYTITDTGPVRGLLDDAQRAEYLPGIAGRGETATLAITERTAAWDPNDVTTIATRSDARRRTR